MRSRGVTVLAVAVLIASCGGPSDQGGSGPFPLAESDLVAAEAYFAPIDAEEEAFSDLRSSGDTGQEAIREFVEAVYSSDIVFHDVAFGDYREGHDNVVAMYRTFLVSFGDAVVDDRPTLVGNPTALQLIPFWDMKLGFSGPTFTEDAPLIEVDLVEIDDDRIGSLLLFYDLASMRSIYGDLPEFEGTLQERYATAWESGSAETIAALYADGAVRHDGLAGLDATGIEAITAEADRWVTALSGATWTVQVPFGDRFGDQVGAVFEVDHDGCTVVSGILFELDEDGLIAHERVHYDPATLRACGWVN
jgi:ketosteroid isomerase-like protein